MPLLDWAGRPLDFLLGGQKAESLPLTPDSASRSRSLRRGKSHLLRDWFKSRDRVRDQCTFYRADDILSWAILFRTSGTVWGRGSLWLTVFRMAVLSLCCGVFTFVVVRDPTRLNIGKFLKLSTFLNIFVSLLLSFFIAHSMTHWNASADGVNEVCTAVRHLQRDLLTLNVEDDKIKRIVRYGKLSAELLDAELHIENMPRSKRSQSWDEEWTLLETKRLLCPAERAALMEVTCAATVIWIWVGSLIGKMATEGDIPPNNSPTYGLLMEHLSMALQGMRRVRLSVEIQPPYLYSQMLAVLVHVNNVINAISFGMTLGAVAGVWLMRLRIDLRSIIGLEKFEGDVRFGEAVRDGQNFIVSFFFSVAGPFLYQALLECAVAIAQPFSSAEGSIPTRWLLDCLERDTQDSLCAFHSLPNETEVGIGSV